MDNSECLGHNIAGADPTSATLPLQHNCAAAIGCMARSAAHIMAHVLKA